MRAPGMSAHNPAGAYWSYGPSPAPFHGPGPRLAPDHGPSEAARCRLAGAQGLRQACPNFPASCLSSAAVCGEMSTLGAVRQRLARTRPRARCQGPGQKLITRRRPSPGRHCHS
ncbi:hypothetical protein TSOC_005575 [Tetrabaena socialis]|uniref:Uncharacterized protein n=1 Tax=Tetrabaena socialis TaxID=47790 RepID=A0A2J8A5V4_9CHLO|nr:hypothetical protein TSOC_005575 [Tetrabaena socialis]|eukprot:PNH07912.1 hypothetical protein TSOC_005575 [Tetrabaena socialis]